MFFADLKKIGAWKDGETVEVAIGKHKIERRDGKHRENLVHGVTKGKKAPYFETYCTVQCIAGGRRFILGILPFAPLDSNEDVVKRLLDTCKMHCIQIKTLMMDREFFSTAIINLMKSLGITYMVPCVNHPSVIAGIREYSDKQRDRVSDAVLTSAGRTTADYSLIITERKRKSRKKSRKKDGEDDGNLLPENKYIGFATNDPDIDVDGYVRRWGIENGYKMIESMRIKTRSKSHGVRVMYFMMTAVLYNAWVCANMMLAWSSHSRILETPVLPLHSLLDVMLAVCVMGSEAGLPPPPPPVLPALPPP